VTRLRNHLSKIKARERSTNERITFNYGTIEQRGFSVKSTC